MKKGLGIQGVLSIITLGAILGSGAACSPTENKELSIENEQLSIFVRERGFFDDSKMDRTPLITPEAVDTSAWKLAFADEFVVFQGCILFATKEDWLNHLKTYGRDDEPCLKKWQYELGLKRNREPQEYVCDHENVRLVGDELHLTARKLETPKPNPLYRPAPKGKDTRTWQEKMERIEYTSGSIETRGRFAFTYGQVEVKAKFPQGKGLWPAIWMLGISRDERGHPDCGEIDILEWVNGTPRSVWSTLHFTGREKLPGELRSGCYTGDDVADNAWHIYTLVWTKSELRFYYDKHEVYRFPIDRANRKDGTNPFREPHYLKLNLALGDPSNWGGELDGDILPRTFAIDYVRIWTPNPLPLGKQK